MWLNQSDDCDERDYYFLNIIDEIFVKTLVRTTKKYIIGIQQYVIHQEVQKMANINKPFEML